jgi:FKBP12-rapamycin complex-associated protein
MASKLDSKWYKAWHAWALANYEVANHYKLNNIKGSESVRILHVITAVQGNNIKNLIFMY